jgi:transcriptional regulator with XRE-family HTH domain
MAQLTQDKFKKALGRKIRSSRQKLGISLKGFESMDGSMDRHYLSKIETGEIMPSVFTLYRIAKSLGISMQELLPE